MSKDYEKIYLKIMVFTAVRALCFYRSMVCRSALLQAQVNAEKDAGTRQSRYAVLTEKKTHNKSLISTHCSSSWH